MRKRWVSFVLLATAVAIVLAILTTREWAISISGEHCAIENGTNVVRFMAHNRSGVLKTVTLGLTSYSEYGDGQGMMFDRTGSKTITFTLNPNERRTIAEVMPILGPPFGRPSHRADAKVLKVD